MKESVKSPVTIVIPCYNNIATIERALNSVLKQTQLPEQIIIVDDASPDKKDLMVTLHRLVSQCAELTECQLIERETNGGPGVARNDGWEVATQPFIAFLDADDSWLPDKLETQVHYMINMPELAVLGHACQIVEKEGSLPHADPKHGKIEFISRMKLLLSNRFSTPTVMLRTNIHFRFLANKYYAEDYLLWLEIVLSGYKVGYISSPLTCLHKKAYGVGGLSASLWSMEKGELHTYKILCKTKKIGLITFGVLFVYSLLKYFRRVVLVTGRRVMASLRN